MSIFDETLTMNNGLKIPEMALGIWEIPDDQTPKAVEEGKLRTIGAPPALKKKIQIT